MQRIEITLAALSSLERMDLELYAAANMMSLVRMLIASGEVPEKVGNMSSCLYDYSGPEFSPSQREDIVRIGHSLHREMRSIELRGN